MTTSTPTLGLILYDSSGDQAVYFSTFRAVIAGTATTSNFYKIDTGIASDRTRISSLENTRGAILVSAIQTAPPSNYTATGITEITAYSTNMTIILKLDVSSSTSVILNINGLGDKTVSKINSSGSIVNISGGELQVGKNYLFRYDGTQWIWVSATSADQIYIAGTSENVVTVNSDNTLLGTTTQSLLLSQTIYNATAKTTLADADTVGITDSASSNILKKITWANFATAIGTKLGSLITALTAKTTPVDADEIVIGDSASSFASKKTSFTNLKAFFKTYFDTLYPSKDGWSPVSDSWSYASTSTITVPSGAASIYGIGDKIKMTNSGTKYNYIVGIADTVLTVKGDGVANAAITAPYYSKDSSPLSFPQYFAYTPTGISASNVTQSARFMISERRCNVDYVASFTGAITFTTMPTLPVTSSASVKTVSISAAGLGGYYNGVVHTGEIIPLVEASATVFLLRTPSGASMSATVPVTWANGYAVEVHFSYEI